MSAQTLPASMTPNVTNLSLVLSTWLIWMVHLWPLWSFGLPGLTQVLSRGYYKGGKSNSVVALLCLLTVKEEMCGLRAKDSSHSCYLLDTYCMPEVMFMSSSQGDVFIYFAWREHR